MIQPTEIRIGNLVLFKPNNYLKVKRLTTISAYFEKNTVIPLNVLYGIPLTEEWFFKVGATIPIEYYGFQFELKISATKISFRCFGANIYSEIGGIYLGDKIKYIHQLQNLYYALTGTELELKK